MAACYECGGTGECPGCHGLGHTLTQKCIVCGGTGGCPRCSPNRNVTAELAENSYEWYRWGRFLLFLLAPLLFFLWKIYSGGPPPTP